MLSVFLALAISFGPAQDYRPDLNLLIDSVKDNGAYVREDHLDLEGLRKAYLPKFENVQDKRQLLTLMESVVGELHDFHATLGTNNDASPRLFPSGADISAHWSNGHALIDEVRPGSIAALSGIKSGDEVLMIHNQPTRDECQTWLGFRKPDTRAWNWALNSALAGRWNAPRTLTLRTKGLRHTVELPTAADLKHKGILTVEHRGSILYLRPENSLGDNGLIAAFDNQVAAMRLARKVVIDLRNTPSGGNSAVARGIMGIFIAKRMPFQRHIAEEPSTGTVRDWVEYATPRFRKPVQTQLIVLVDQWTGSMGEGIAIGFDALHRGTVVGTQMARLRGAVDRIDLPKAGFGVVFPTEKVFHMNGTPRHEWMPPVVVKPGSGDPWWKAAVKVGK